MDPGTLILFDCNRDKLVELEAETFREAFELATERANCFHAVWANPNPRCERVGCNVRLHVIRFDDTLEAALPLFHSALGETLEALDEAEARCTLCGVQCIWSLNGEEAE